MGVVRNIPYVPVQSAVGIWFAFVRIEGKIAFDTVIQFPRIRRNVAVVVVLAERERERAHEERARAKASKQQL